MSLTRCYRMVAMLFLSMALSGCFGGSDNAKEVEAEIPHYYVVDVDRGLVEDPFPQGRILYLQPVRVTSQFRDHTIVFRVGANEYQPQDLHQFFSEPEEMFTEQLKRWLQKSGLFTQVTTDKNVQADMVMEAAVTALYGEARPQQLPQSILEMQFFLLSADKNNSKLLMQTGLRMEVDIKQTTPRDVVKGWKLGLEELFLTLEDDLSGYFSKRTP